MTPAVISCVLAVLLGAAPAWAAGLAWKAAPDAPVVGDAITARLTFSGPPGATVDWGDTRPVFEGAEADPEAVATADGALVYTLHADLPGQVVLPRVTLPYTEPDGRKGRVSADRATLVVAGVFDPDNPPPPAPAKGPLSVPMPWWPFAVGAALLAAVAGAAWRFRGRKAQPAVAEPVVPPRPPLETALARLAALDPSAEPRVVFAGLSAIARDYLAGRHGIPAPVLTGAETAAAIRAAGHDGLVPLAEWLPRWDFYKFAPVVAPDGAAARAVSELGAWLRAQPVAEPEPEPAEARA